MGTGMGLTFNLKGVHLRLGGLKTFYIIIMYKYSTHSMGNLKLRK